MFLLRTGADTACGCLKKRWLPDRPPVCNVFPSFQKIWMCHSKYVQDRLYEYPSLFKLVQLQRSLAFKLALVPFRSYHSLPLPRIPRIYG